MFTQPSPVADQAPAFTAPHPAVHAAPAAAPVFAQTPTPEQGLILDAARTGADLVIEAGAGTGKTTTLKMAAQVVGGRSAYIAYNKAIAEDARASFPSGTHCSTAHSMAFQAVGRQYSDRLKAPRVPAREVARILGIPAVVDLGVNALTNVKVARVVTDTIDRFCHSADPEIHTSHVPDVPGLTPESATALRMEVVPLARRAWHDLTQLDGKLRFTHDTYLKMWAMGDPVLPYNTVFLDEAQDANPVIAQVVLRQHAQRILVGDRSQAIYGWRGAIDAMQAFLATGATRFVLTQSWRFGQAIADEANEWLGLLDAPIRLTGNPDRASTLEGLTDADAILCRTNAGAIAEVITALDAGKRAAMVGGGDDIRRLAEACRDLRNGRATSHPELAAFNNWAEVKEYAEHDAGGADLKVFVKLIDTHGPQRIIDVVNRLVPEEGAHVVVSTAHRAKGREWPKVRCASDFAALPYVDTETGEVTAAEVMLRYVACTRARDALDAAGAHQVALFDRQAERDARHADAVDAMAGGLVKLAAPTTAAPEQAGAVELPEGVVGWLKLHKDAAVNEASWAAIKAQAAEKVKEFLGDAEEATVGGLPAVTWKWSKPGGQLAGAELKKDHPDIYAKYYKPKTAARPFKLTGAWAE